MLKSKLYLIDGTSYIFRAYWALKHLSNSQGFPTNAIFVFTNMLLKVLRECAPTHVAIVFDAPGPTFRDEIYPDYKATRPPPPEDLLPQIPIIKEIVREFGVPNLEIPLYEADDVIGTLARQAESQDFEVIIVTGDKDFMQLVTENISIYDPMKDKHYHPPEVVERWGVEPDRVVEVMGLAGDSTDNIPGVPRIGEKTAISLIREFGTIEQLLANLENVKRDDIRASLEEHSDDALKSKDLATIRTDVPLTIGPRELTPGKRNVPRLHEIFRELDFNKLLTEVTAEKTLSARDYHLVLSEDELRQLAEKLRASRAFVLDIETTSPNPMRSLIVGIALSCSEGEAYYVPLRHSYIGVPDQISFDTAISILKPVLEDETVRKAAHDIKFAVNVLRRHAISLRCVAADPAIASYLLDPSKPTHSLPEIALTHLNHKMTPRKEITRKGKKELGFEEIDLESASNYACEVADVTFRAAHVLLMKLRESGFEQLYRDMELPLTEVLSDMEMAGVKVDTDLLSRLSREFEAPLASLAKVIYALADEEFNINSHQQLSKILFEKLKFKRTKRTKTGASTDIDVLSALADEGHELPAKILEYRSLFKLKSTYVDSLRDLIHPDTGRIHTSFNQTVTATGRLSSSDPNLQNIPIRTPEGRKIRSAFVAEPGHVLLSADYSQIELRLLAHMSGDERMLESFRKGEDIHAATAAEIFGVGLSEVTPEARRRAKAVNFGIVYGMSPYGLAKELGITDDEAKVYITKYFARYPGVQEYIARTLEEARRNKFVTTMFGRRRPLPDITSNRGDHRLFAERVAMNAPLQGSAADIIKIAMINVRRALSERRLATRMLIQVHDELVFEVPEDEIPEAMELVKKEMSSVVGLKVPLIVDAHYAANWAEAHP